ncbi:hypothetical protein KBZ21_41115, partial [Streptomyces sp. A73]|nr:hypothetical protein [Streptomyces sp. A73]
LAALPPADQIQFELADVDERFHIQHGPDDSWLDGTWRAYDAAATFAAELTEELELPDYAEDACDIADRMGFNPQRWIDAEY